MSYYQFASLNYPIVTVPIDCPEGWHLGKCNLYFQMLIEKKANLIFGCEMQGTASIAVTPAICIVICLIIVGVKKVPAHKKFPKIYF